MIRGPRLLLLLSLATVLLSPSGRASAPRPGPAVAAPASPAQKQRANIVPRSALHNPVLWHDPGNVAALDLLHGPAGAQGMPLPAFTFEREIRTGARPVFEVHDDNGKRWAVELGRDARPEVAASRLLWAAGFYTDQDYVLWKATVSGLHLRNARRYIHHDTRRVPGSRRRRERVGEDYISDARFVLLAPGQQELGNWSWRSNPFNGTRQLNALRVMMAVLNCWDLRDENNTIVGETASATEQFRMSGVGASFGRTHARLFRRSSRDSARDYERTRFITRRTATTVDFATPASSYNPFSLFHRRTSTTWIGRNIPRADARWIGSILAQLSHKQIEDAFWAAGYSVNDVNTFANTVEARIRALGDL